MKAVILENKKVISSYYKMKLSCDGFSGASPGQFVMIRVNNFYDPFLRRPMSIYRITPHHPPLRKGGRGGVEILYQVVGKGTNIMSELKEGDEIDVLGPLGRGFCIPEKIERAIIVAGGIGVAPMAALSEKLRITNNELRISVFIGGKTKNDILCKEDFKKIGAKVHIATEDGSMGKKGTSVDLFKKFATDSQSSIFNLQSSIIFACGPNGMLKAVADISINKNISCQVSLDKNMACGTGACLGCVVKVKSPESPLTKGDRGGCYKCVCKDGPIFDAGEILWEEI